MFTLKIATDNDAFTDSPGYEVACILRELADRLEGGSFSVGDIDEPVRDANGNTVGRATFR